MNKLFLMMALFSFAGITAAATSDSQARARSEAADSPHGGMLTKPGAGLPSGHPGSIPADTNLVNSGKVLEVLDTDMYTYLQVTSEKGPLWLSVYKANVSKGAIVKYSNGIAMSQFYSKALKRTFDIIVFVDAIEQVK